MRRPKGIKTKKSAAKRFKKTSTGRLRHEQTNRQHLFEYKPSTRTRRLEGVVVVPSGRVTTNATDVTAPSAPDASRESEKRQRADLVTLKAQLDASGIAQTNPRYQEFAARAQALVALTEIP